MVMAILLMKVLLSVYAFIYPYSPHSRHNFHTTVWPRDIQCANILKQKGNTMGYKLIKKKNVQIMALQIEMLSFFMLSVPTIQVFIKQLSFSLTNSSL